MLSMRDREHIHRHDRHGNDAARRWRHPAWRHARTRDRGVRSTGIAARGTHRTTYAVRAADEIS
jgi:hypothetical protein